MLFCTAPERDKAVNIFEIKFKLEGDDENTGREQTMERNFVALCNGFGHEIDCH
jgi:hypothetical protein